MDGSIERRDAGLLALRERKRVLDAIWLATLLLLLAAIAVPWYVRILDIDLGRLTWVLFGYALTYLGATLAADRLRSSRGILGMATALQIVGILVLGLVWYLLGGAHTPMFLLAFVVPVVASGILTLRWLPYALAALAVLVAWSVAALTSPSLRWYLVQLDIPLAGWLTSLPLGALRGPFPGLEVDPAYVVVLMELFAVVLFAVAMATESLTTVLLRLTASLHASGEALREAEGLAQRVLQASLHPIALVDRSTHRVVQASDSFVRQFLLKPSDLADRTLVDLLDMPFPEPLHAALAQGGEVSFAICRVDGETRIARISVCLIEHAGTDYAHVSVHDVSDLYYLQGALEVIDAPYLLLGADRRILYFNRAAESLFGQLYSGMPASGTLEPDGTPSRWWDLTPRRSHRRQLSIKDTPYRADLAAADLPGHAGSLTVVTLQPAEMPS
jgi:PAS domain-containing protein